MSLVRAEHFCAPFTSCSKMVLDRLGRVHDKTKQQLMEMQQLLIFIEVDKTDLMPLVYVKPTELLYLELLNICTW